MREIKFRALETETNSWCIGSTSPKNKEVRIDAFWTYYFEGLLKKETIGTFTNRKDKNDKEIYEGHIVTHPDCNDHIVIKWCWDRWIQDVYYKGKPNYTANYKWYELEIIGNISENPELIKE